MSIAERMPEVGRRFYDHVLARTVNRLAIYLEARVQIGDLVIDDDELAAWQFMQMCQATLFQAFIFQASLRPRRRGSATVVDQCDAGVFGGVSRESGLSPASRSSLRANGSRTSAR